MASTMRKSDEKAPGVPECNRRQAGSRVSYNNTNRSPYAKEGEGKFAGIGAKGGTMGKGGKRGY